MDIKNTRADLCYMMLDHFTLNMRKRDFEAVQEEDISFLRGILDDDSSRAEEAAKAGFELSSLLDHRGRDDKAIRRILRKVAGLTMTDEERKRMVCLQRGDVLLHTAGEALDNIVSVALGKLPWIDNIFAGQRKKLLTLPTSRPPHR